MIFALLGILGGGAIAFFAIRRAIRKASGLPVFHFLKRGHGTHWY